MKKKTAATLLGLMEVKTQIEKSGYAALMKRQRAAFDDAEALRRDAGETLAGAGAAVCAETMRHAAACAGRLYDDARRRRRDGEAIENEKHQQGALVRTALQREMAAQRLVKTAQTEDRKRRNDAEETSRELTLSARARRR